MSLICGECKYSEWDEESNDFVCTNEESEAYGLPIEFTDSCMDGEKGE